ncbi:MAG: patatin-like phospholipase family protein [Bacteroidota bacterium]
MSKQIALVLSGGGARGLAHIGVIEEILEQGHEIVSIAGTSMGSLIGGIYALGEMQTLKDWFYTLDRQKVLSLVDFTFNSQGLVKGDRVIGTIQELIPDKKIEELAIPYVAVAADIINRKEVVFREGSLYEAIRSSIAIPTVLTPVPTENGLLVDGGVLNNIPTNHVHRPAGSQLVAVNVNAQVPKPDIPFTKEEEPIKRSLYEERMEDFLLYLQKLGEGDEEKNQNEMGYFDVINKVIELTTQRMVELSLDLYPPDVLINISEQTSSIFDFFMAEELVEVGRMATRAQLKDLT